MNKAYKRSIKLDLSLTISPQSILEDNYYSNSKESLFNGDRWHQELTDWFEFISTKEDSICPEVVINAEKLSLGLQFTDDATIYKLNSKWRDKQEVTDVLSFPLLDGSDLFPSFECVELGDIVISVASARRQATEYQHDFERELRWLASHGFLHLLGWDHPDEKSLNKMLHIQEQILDINGNL